MLRALAIAALAKVEIDTCFELGTQLMGVAELDDDATLRVEAHYVLGMCLHLGGNIVGARSELEASLSLYDRERSHAHQPVFAGSGGGLSDPAQPRPVAPRQDKGFRATPSGKPDAC